jgi:hypothetical protein
MFFIASKIFWFVAEPVSLAIVVGVLGILLGFTRFARAGRAVMAGAIIVLAGGLLTPLGAVLLRPLEERFPPPPADIPAPAGIIVLGGAVDTEKSEARGQVRIVRPVLNTDLTRCSTLNALRRSRIAPRSTLHARVAHGLLRAQHSKPSPRLRIAPYSTLSVPRRPQIALCSTLPALRRSQITPRSTLDAT